MTRIVTVLIVAFSLSACGDSEDKIYERGYYEGAGFVCHQVKKIDSNFHRKLQSQGTCK